MCIVRFQARADIKGQSLSHISGSEAEGEVHFQLRLEPGVQEQGIVVAATDNPQSPGHFLECPLELYGAGSQSGALGPLCVRPLEVGRPLSTVSHGQWRASWLQLQLGDSMEMLATWQFCRPGFLICGALHI